MSVHLTTVGSFLGWLVFCLASLEATAAERSEDAESRASSSSKRLCRSYGRIARNATAAKTRGRPFRLRG